jgi:hypothetical protein
VKTTFKFALIVVLSLGASTVLAFHGGGVADCAGCHTMHNSQDGEQVTDSATGYNYLLIEANSTDVCLSCHAAYGQMWNGLGYGPGGDFYWLTKTYTWTSHGATETSTGDSHGHNVISPAFNIAMDAALASAPGGDFGSQHLTCTSCHDPHGNQNFRLLYGSAMGPIYGGSRYDFANDAPLAKGNSRRTIVGATNGNETDAKHTIYKNGMSEWCANCHADFLSGTSTSHVHPAGEDMGGMIASAYNAYVSTENISGGNIATAYRGLVPFEIVNINLATVNSMNYTIGPDGVDQVMCVSCHRPHASAFPDAGRWDFGAELMNASHPATGDGGATPEDVTNKYYQYTFTAAQKSLCNKCHVKDEFDRL